jgi:DNA polymerase
MNLITVDFESYYSKDFGFSKMTTEEYVRHPDFEVIGVGIKENDGETEWFSGDALQTLGFLMQYDWQNSFVLAHNTAFDGAILSWLFGIRPKGWLDTLSMARAIHGVSVGGSLAKLATHYEVGEKGNEVVDALGLRRKEFAPAQLAQYGEYCKNDVQLCYDIFHLMMAQGFPALELKVIDATLKMFVEPILELDLPLLEQHLEEVQERKERLLAAVQADKELLMSNDKFAELLKKLKVNPPTKVSAKTGKEAWAFAKTDEGFKALEQHPDPKVQALVAARLGNKSTLEETRTQRFIDIAKRGSLPVPLKYYAAHTGRWGGDDKVNLQNLPSRGQNAGKLKNAIRAPKGFVMIDSDSSQIEARTLAWLAGQADLVEFFEKNNAEIAAGVPKKEMQFDPYKIMAAQIYGKQVDQITDPERFVGKTTILGAGYGMGGDKFQAQLKTFNVDIPLDECKRIIEVYRKTYDRIPALWREAQNSLSAMVRGQMASVGREGVLQFDPVMRGFVLPNGLPLRYDMLRTVTDPQGRQQFEYKTRMGWTKIYGGKVVENLCQALARCVIAEQMIKIGKRYKTVLTVHDAVACIALKEKANLAQAYVEDCMRWTPAWATGLPLNCESGVAESYGEC